jgi:hypothetical protein
MTEASPRHGPHLSTAFEDDDPLVVMRCWHCDFGTGQRGCDRCSKCQGTGSLFWANGRAFPYTPEGEKMARRSMEPES